MRRGQRQNAILNSPVVRSFINPVVSTIPTSPAKPATTQAGSAPSETAPDGGVEADERFFIPTQPLANGSGAGPGTSDVKGKKRAREDDDDAALVEYDAVAGTRYGVPVRYSEDNLPEELEKYWAQRYRLLSRFDEGCEMDREGWYSVTPENIAIQIAERCRSGVIVDAFCGVGGNAIQFAFTCERVIALDTSPIRLACAAHNARIYGVADRITFIQSDWVAWTEQYLARLERGGVKDEDKIEVVFLSPPWGGIDYQTAGSAPAAARKKPRRSSSSGITAIPHPGTPTPALVAPSAVAAPPAYPLSALAPLHGRDLFSLARRCTRNVAYYLPRNVDLLELARLPGRDEGEKIEVEEEWMGGKLKAVTAYFGELAVGNGWVQEVDCDED
ncbi:RNA methyltransferase [Rhodotorula paludigena]|uniref:RNA methyltransferase n=1 Tax=Rhodotorula paludigena TaxID=86838 RepID=UPI003172EC34